MKKKLYLAMYVIIVMFIVWVLMSFVNIQTHNKFGDYNYAAWNFFTLVFERCKAW